jgi:hypothetical protein
LFANFFYCSYLFIWHITLNIGAIREPGQWFQTSAKNFKYVYQIRYRNYRVSRSKEGKVILLWWGYRFRFLLIFWVLCVHEKGTFMLNSSVFIFLMLRALYRMICKNAKSFLGKNSIHVSNVKLFSKMFFQWLFYAFFVGMTAYTLHIKWFPGIKNLNGLNDLNSLNNLGGLNDVFSLILSKNL